jgi:hypothetical protein
MLTIDQVRKLKRGDKVVDTYGKVYDFGYISQTNAAVVYDEGEYNMQDASAFRLLSDKEVSEKPFYKLRIK